MTGAEKAPCFDRKASGTAGPAPTTGMTLMDTILLQVEGMSCQGCVRSVSAALTALPGVETVTVSLAEGRASVTFDPTRASGDDLRQAIAEAGFDSR